MAYKNRRVGSMSVNELIEKDLAINKKKEILFSLTLKNKHNFLYSRLAHPEAIAIGKGGNKPTNSCNKEHFHRTRTYFAGLDKTKPGSFESIYKLLKGCNASIVLHPR